MKNIYRWGLMRNTRRENLSEHSLEVAQIAHALQGVHRAVDRGLADFSLGEYRGGLGNGQPLGVFDKELPHRLTLGGESLSALIEQGLKLFRGQARCFTLY